MPYQWTTRPDGAEELMLWPHRSLPRRGFVWFVAGTAAFAALPMLAVLGTAVLWGLLPFVVVTIGGLYWALGRSYHSAKLHEVLRLWPDRLELQRTEADGRTRDWQAQPYWVHVTLHPKGGPVPDYLTLGGAGREVELGAFLTPEERADLARALDRRLAALKGQTVQGGQE